MQALRTDTAFLLALTGSVDTADHMDRRGWRKKKKKKDVVWWFGVFARAQVPF